MIKLDRQYFSQDLNAKADLLEDKALDALEKLKTKNCTGSEFTGWYDWPRVNGFKLLQEIKDWRSSYKESFDLVVVIGIGGSYLGSKALSDVISHTYGFNEGVNRKANDANRPQLVFAGQNMSESSLSDLLDLMSNKSPIVNIISKSGTTTEPGVAFRVIRSWMEKRYGSAAAARRIIATTDPSKGALRKLALGKSYKTFVVPDDVGGRYSVLTAVGLVPLALVGYDVDALMHGADETFQDLNQKNPTKIGRIALDYAKCRTASWNAGKVIEVVTYPEPRMRNLVEWFKQLFGESDGKDGKGLFPASIECTMDLHSMGQYMQEGARSMIETFLAVDNPRGDRSRIDVPETSDNTDELSYLEGAGIDLINDTAMLATRIAHSSGGVPCLELRLSDFEPKTLGSLFAMYEASCAIGGLMLGINPFNQPGVEAYKVNLFALLGKPGFGHLKESIVR
jgi:glucose-6-phosphate isomerase